MTERKYSVSEIDQMRAALTKKLGDGSTLQWGDTVESLERRESRAAARIEDQLRTYMIAGIDPTEVGKP